jgi:hypothetical protein
VTIKNTAWYDQRVLPEQMVRGALGLNGWPRLENSDHFSVLDDLVNMSSFSRIGDLGCGAGEIGRVYSKYQYTGYDLPHIIEKVSRVVNPTLNYVSFDAYDFDYSIIQKHDMIICNSFISELKEPLRVMQNILNNVSKYLLLHRQQFSNSTKFQDYSTYGDLITPRSFIGVGEFNNMLKEHKVIKQVEFHHGMSVLIERK